MRKRGKEYKPKPLLNDHLRKLQTHNTLTNSPINNVSYYLANTLVYLASRKRVQEDLRVINKAFAYLHELDSPSNQQKREIWNRAALRDVRNEFKNLSEVVRYNHTTEDSEKALICLKAMCDLLQRKSDVLQIAQTVKARQLIQEFKHGYDLSGPPEGESLH